MIRRLVDRVDVAVVSPAERTQQTWALLAGPLGEVAEVRSDDRIYREWGAGLLDVVRDLPDAAGTALIVGHEPGVSELVLDLADRGAPALRDRIAATPGCAALESFVTPRQLRG